MSSEPPSSSVLSDFVGALENRLSDSRETAVVMAPSPMMDDPPEALEEPVLDGDNWREWGTVKEETTGEPTLIMPPTFDKGTWQVTDPDAPGVTPHYDQPSQ